MVPQKKFTLPKTNMAPTNGWLEYYFPIGEAYFQGRLLLVSGRVNFWFPGRDWRGESKRPVVFIHGFYSKHLHLGIPGFQALCLRMRVTSESFL